MSSSSVLRREEEETVRGWLRGVLGHEVDAPTLKSLLRGPMREVLLTFLVPQVRSTEEVKVIRGNIFAMGGGPSKVLDEEEDEEMTALRRELEDVDRTLQQLRSDVVQEGRRSGGAVKKVDEAASLVGVQRGVLADLLQLDSEVTSYVAAEESSTALSSSECFESMDAVLEESTQMFRSLFMDEDLLVDSDVKIRETLASLSKVIGPGDLRSWTEAGISAGEEKLGHMEGLFNSGVVFDPVEVIKAEFKEVEGRLTKEHLEAYATAEGLAQRLEEGEHRKEEKMAEGKARLVKVTGGLVFPEDFAKAVELKAKIKRKCAERKVMESTAMVTPPAVTLEDAESHLRLKNEKRLEKVTLGLLRSFPNQLEKTEDLLLGGQGISL